MMEELKVDSKAECDVPDMFIVSRCCRTYLCETVYMPRLAIYLLYNRTRSTEHTHTKKNRPKKT